MINSGKCPKCGTTISSVRVEDIDVKIGFQSAWKGVSRQRWPSCTRIALASRKRAKQLCRAGPFDAEELCLGQSLALRSGHFFLREKASLGMSGGRQSLINGRSYCQNTAVLEETECR